MVTVKCPSCGTEEKFDRPPEKFHCRNCCTHWLVRKNTMTVEETGRLQLQKQACEQKAKAIHNVLLFFVHLLGIALFIGGCWVFSQHASHGKIVRKDPVIAGAFFLLFGSIIPPVAFYKAGWNLSLKLAGYRPDFDTLDQEYILDRDREMQA